MALVYGQIDTLKQIRRTLDEKGISRFNSTGDLNNFVKNYENEKEEILFKIEHDFDLELEVLEVKGTILQRNYDTLNNKAETKLKGRISKLRQKCERLSSIQANNAIMELAYWYQLQFLLGVKFILEKSFNLIIRIQTNKSRKSLNAIKEEINALAANRQSIISSRCESKFIVLEYVMNVVTDLNPLIAGAIGENLIQKELEKLSDSYVLFNDFSLGFNKPIYNKKENDRIFSIQIDHLLVTNAGIFNIETKNWSKESIARLDMRSPISQIRRSSYALFVILNSSEQGASHILKSHHWGDKKIPSRILWR
ncbi:nuclease-related domain-containing protein [Eudoraea adriatica]|uniref:nuclease-related domain-containing protein n=1 Tax=Eudoraea adriatica TaxID=446681 RepID=UPI0003610B6E|nr:nuclease-related domain-containing protein [Eudoraea adriatica]